MDAIVAFALTAVIGILGVLAVHSALIAARALERIADALDRAAE